MPASICHFANYFDVSMYCAVDHNNILNSSSSQIEIVCSTLQVTMQWGALLMIIIYRRRHLSAHDANAELCTDQNSADDHHAIYHSEQFSSVIHTGARM